MMPAVANQLGAAAGLLSNWFAVTVILSTQEKGHSIDIGYAVILDSDFRSLKKFPEHSKLSSFKQIFAEINLEHQQAAAVASEIKLLE